MGSVVPQSVSSGGAGRTTAGAGSLAARSVESKWHDRIALDGWSLHSESAGDRSERGWRASGVHRGPLRFCSPSAAASPGMGSTTAAMGRHPRPLIRSSTVTTARCRWVLLGSIPASCRTACPSSRSASTMARRSAAPGCLGCSSRRNGSVDSSPPMACCTASIDHGATIAASCCGVSPRIVSPCSCLLGVEL